jgi:hypothetical protein
MVSGLKVNTFMAAHVFYSIIPCNGGNFCCVSVVLYQEDLAIGLKIFFFLQYIKQHVIPLEEVKLESLEDDGRKYF